MSDYHGRTRELLGLDPIITKEDAGAASLGRSKRRHISGRLRRMGYESAERFLPSAQCWSSIHDAITSGGCGKSPTFAASAGGTAAMEQRGGHLSIRHDRES